MKQQRHQWGQPNRFPHKTERQCLKCGLIKVSRHEAEGPRDTHWTEWWRGLDEIASNNTPPCDLEMERA